MTHLSGQLSEAYAVDSSEMNHCSYSLLSKAASTGGTACTGAGLVVGKTEPSSSFPSVLRLPRLHLKLDDFNLSKLFTSMPPRLLLVCHEGADR